MSFQFLFGFEELLAGGTDKGSLGQIDHRLNITRYL
jgi:hypothetical protein